MLTNRKQQGFIIRRTKKPQQDKQERKKYMSQTQFYRRGSASSGYRTPGSILHVKLKQDIGWYENPENGHFPDIKYDFQENDINLKQKGQNNNNDNSFQEVAIESRVQQYPGLDLEHNVFLAKILQSLNYKLHHRSDSSDVLKYVKQYLDYISNHELASVNNLNIPLVRKKLLKTSLLNERIAILLIGFAQVNGIFDICKSFIINLASYSLQNLLLRLAILTEGKEKQVVEILKQQGKENFLNKSFQTIKNINQIMGEAITKVSKHDNLLYENLKKIMKANKTLHVKGQFAAIQEYFAFFMYATERAGKAPFLAIAPAPYLPPQDFDKFTLVIDVIQCFCSHSKKSTQSFRPFAQYFLDQMSQYYEIVSFCDTMPNQVNKVISLLDRKKQIKHRLYKHHLDKTKNFKGKDLSRLGRDINSVILIDTSIQCDPYNTVVLNQWKGKRNDAELAELCPILAMIAIKKMNVQKSIKKLHQKNEQNHKIGLKYQNCGIDFQQ